MRRSILAAVVFAVLTCAGEGWAQTWKPFQELGFLTGSWSGSGESAGRIAGVTASWGMEMNGNFLMHTTNVVLPASEGKTEESIRIVGYYSYDRDRRKYVAYYFFSTGILGTFDADLAADARASNCSPPSSQREAGPGRGLDHQAQPPPRTSRSSWTWRRRGKTSVPFVIAKLAKR
jgi:hypothetical protein